MPLPATSTTTPPQAVAVVTGAARGIGLAITRWFLHQGYRVAMLDISTSTLEQAQQQLNLGERVLACVCDVSNPQAVQASSQRVMQEFGRVDALVNNAGVASFGPAIDTSFDTWRETMATNLDGVFLCTQAFGRHMLAAQTGSIVNIASISGMRASLLRVAYGTSKAAVMHLTRQYAAEWGALGVRVNAVCPGPVETEMAKQVHSAAIRRDYHNAIPLGRYGSEDEMAQVVGFLCSDQASFINGQCLGVDGGFDATGIGLPTFRQEQASR